MISRISHNCSQQMLQKYVRSFVWLLNRLLKRTITLLSSKSFLIIFPIQNNTCFLVQNFPHLSIFLKNIEQLFAFSKKMRYNRITGVEIRPALTSAVRNTESLLRHWRKEKAWTILHGHRNIWIRQQSLPRWWKSCGSKARAAVRQSRKRWKRALHSTKSVTMNACAQPHSSEKGTVKPLETEHQPSGRNKWKHLRLSERRLEKQQG